MKKIFVGLTVLALVALVATPASAFWGVDDMQGNLFNSAEVINDVTVVSDTGYNGIGNSVNRMTMTSGNISSGNDDNEIDTGDATAKAKVGNVVNSNVTMGGCCGADMQLNLGNDALVVNLVGAGAYTGDNGIANSDNKGVCVDEGKISSGNDDNSIDTGEAVANAKVGNLVNSNVELDGCCGDQIQKNVGNGAGLGNEVVASTGTGGNEIADSQNKWVGADAISSNNDGNSIDTGGADAGAKVVSVVNSNITRGFGL
ncbi:hypothetical protein ACFL11_00285 [Patescibacteria group bacterium]